MKAMFKKRLLKLADIIDGTTKPLKDEGKPVRFDMSRYISHTECGTACCIAGTAALLADPNGVTEWTANDIAKKWLGLDAYDASVLFLPYSYNGSADWSRITSRRGAAVLRHFAETGEIKWNMKLS